MATDSALMPAATGAMDRSTELMLRVRDGDSRAFAELVELWQKRLVNLFFHHTGDHAIAEDLAQETFMRVYRARDRYRPTARFTTWVHTIALHVASDLKQRAYRRHEWGVAPTTTASSSSVGLDHLAVEKSGMMPARAADRVELQSLVQRALGELGERQRMALLLAKFEQCSYEEIAEALETSVPAVKSLIFRARDQLRQSLAGYMEGDGHG